MDGNKKGTVRTLTKKQAAFALKCAEDGVTRVEAYRAVYSPRAKDTVARVKAAELMRNPRVRARYEAAMAQKDGLIKDDAPDTAILEEMTPEKVRAILVKLYADISTGRCPTKERKVYGKDGEMIRYDVEYSRTDQAQAAEKLASFYGVTAADTEAAGVRIVIDGGGEDLAE